MSKDKMMSKEDILKSMGIDPSQVVKAKSSNSATLSEKGKVRNEIKEGMDKAIMVCKYNKLIRTTTLKAQNDPKASPKVKDFEGRFIVIDNKEKGEYEIVVPKLYFETYTTPYVNFLDDTK